MKKISHLTLIVVLLALLSGTIAQAQEIPMITLQPHQPPQSTPAGNLSDSANPTAVNCPGGVNEAGECPFHPTSVSADSPPTAVNYDPQPIDPTFSQVPYSYAKLNIESWEAANIFSSAAEAAAGANPINQIPPGGIRYVSYVNRMDIDGGKYVLAKNGGWLRASPAAVSSVILGRTFSAPPTTNFGWVFEAAYPYVQPNYANGQNPNVYFNREQVLQVFEVVENENGTWFRVGENQWLDRIHFRAAIIDSQPPAEVTADRWIEVDLAEQVVLVYENRRLVYATMVATGMEPFFTQPGVFQIYEKKEAENMTGSFESDRSDFYSLEDVPYVLYYDQARAFHGAYWRAWYGIEQSHGCINMTIGDSRWLYDWASVGDFVWVHDRTGKTPTDPNFYGAGGA